MLIDGAVTRRSMNNPFAQVVQPTPKGEGRKAEDLFVLAADTGLRNIKVILGPQDFRRKRRLPAGPSGPRWIESVYDQVEAALKELPNPPL